MTISASSLLSVVVPCFNEERGVPRLETELLPALDALGPPYEMIAVDDGSTDATFAALAALAGRYQRVRIVKHPLNRGLGMALRTGFAAAKGGWIATLDADLTFHPRHLAALLACQRSTGADMVAGSPFLDPAGASEVSWSRRLPSAMINAFYRALFGASLTAYTPIMRLYRAEALHRLPLSSAGFEINAEIAARFLKAGLAVAEAPVPLTTRREGVSKLNRLRELARHGLLIVNLAGRC